MSDQLHAEIRITALLARYADAVVRRDPDDWIATWAPDAIWSLAGTEITGREAILDTWQRAMASFPFVIHTVTPPVLRIDGDQARGRCSVQEVLRSPDGSARQIFGTYHDRFVLTQDWHFAHRRFDVLLARPLDLAGADVVPWPADVDPDFMR